MSKRRIARRSCEFGCIVRRPREIAENTHSQRQQSRLQSRTSEIQFIKFLAVCNSKMSQELLRLPGVNWKRAWRETLEEGVVTEDIGMRAIPVPCLNSYTESPSLQNHRLAWYLQPGSCSG